MLGCLISLIIVVIIALIVVYVIEAVVGTLISFPPPIFMLIRLLIGLLVLLYALGCLSQAGLFTGVRFYPYR